MSSTKQEVHNIANRNATRGETSHGHRLPVNMHIKLHEVWPCSFRDMRADRQTNKKTDI